MDERREIEENNPAEETSEQSFAPYSPVTGNARKPEKLKFGTKEWIILAAALAASLYPAFCLKLTFIFENGFPGVGSALFLLAVEAFGIYVIGKNGQWTKGNLFMLASGAVCALTLGISSSYAVRALNHLASFVFIAIGLLCASGMNRFPLTRAAVLWESFVNTFSALFGHFFKPFSGISNSLGGKKKGVLGVILGIAVCVPLLAVVIALLSSADVSFSAFLEEINEKLGGLSFEDVIARGIGIVFYTLVFFSIFFSLARPKNVMRRDPHAPAIPESAFITVLAVLAVVYMVFLGVQVDALFGGSKTAIDAGGYAYYARDGFFQLVVVSAINLAAVMAAQYSQGEHRGVRVFCMVLCVLTALLLASAVWRMCLYIKVYGLSFLRFMTFYAMAVIACADVLCAVKAFKPECRMFSPLLICAVGLWVLFTLAPCRIISDYNVNAFLSGKVEQVDVYYLSSLSPSAVPSLRRLADAGNADAARVLKEIEEDSGRFCDYMYPDCPWYIWSADMIK